MARTVDAEAHAKRRNAFLDAAQRLLVTKGYERMTIQDVIDDLGTSKGALYHYFGSKPALIEGLVERLTHAGVAHLAVSMRRSELPAVQKLRLFFVLGGQWKVERRQLYLAMLPLWCSDGNAVFRQKMRLKTVERIEPLLADIIEQGVREGDFTPAHPKQVVRIIVGLLNDCGDVVTALLLAAWNGHGDRQDAEATLTAYADAFERVLGAPPGSLVLIDTAQLHLWFDAADSGPHHDTAHMSKKEPQWQDALT